MPERLGSGAQIEADQATNEEPQSSGLPGSELDIVRSSAGPEQHSFKGRHVVRRQLLVATQPLEGHVILVVPQVGGRLGAEANGVGSWCRVGQRNVHRFAEGAYRWFTNNSTARRAYTQAARGSDVTYDSARAQSA